MRALLVALCLASFVAGTAVLFTVSGERAYGAVCTWIGWDNFQPECVVVSDQDNTSADSAFGVVLDTSVTTTAAPGNVTISGRFVSDQSSGIITSTAAVTPSSAEIGPYGGNYIAVLSGRLSQYNQSGEFVFGAVGTGCSEAYRSIAVEPLATGCP